MKKILVLLFAPLMIFGQAETHNFVTYDTLINGIFLARITRPVAYFTTDTASRVLIMTADGDGEQGTDTTKLVAYGPHYLMSKGLYDGSVQLGNGTHYPIFITIQPTMLNSIPGGIYTEPLLQAIVKEFHPRSIHCAGLSHGASLWLDLVAYAATATDVYPMQNIKSVVAMQSIGGTPDGNQSPFNQPFPTCFKTWATTYGGRYFGIEGTNDFRQTWLIAQAMNAVVPNSGYESLENDGGGIHGFWNDFYAPTTFWQNVTAPYGNPWIVQSSNNSPGSYIGTGNLYSWMMRQGDTALVGFSGNLPPVTVPPVVTPPITPPVIVPPFPPNLPISTAYAALDSFAATLDHVDSIQITTTNNAPTNIDTLKLTKGYQSRVVVAAMNSAPVTGDQGQCEITYQVVNSNGTPVGKNYLISGDCREPGALAPPVSVVINYSGGFAIVQINGRAGTTINWTVYVHSLLGKL